MVKTTSIASQDISMQSKCLVNQKKINVQYYSNYFATCRIIWSGDIETNPGTGLSKPKCQVCDKTAQCNQNSSSLNTSLKCVMSMFQSSTEPKCFK